jgi:hypothetical protein
MPARLGAIAIPIPPKPAPMTTTCKARALSTERPVLFSPGKRPRHPIVTSDPGDLTRIADSIGVKIRLFRT